MCVCDGRITLEVGVITLLKIHHILRHHMHLCQALKIDAIFPALLNLRCKVTRLRRLTLTGFFLALYDWTCNDNIS